MVKLWMRKAYRYYSFVVTRPDLNAKYTTSYTPVGSPKYCASNLLLLWRSKLFAPKSTLGILSLQLQKDKLLEMPLGVLLCMKCAMKVVPLTVVGVKYMVLPMCMLLELSPDNKRIISDI